MADLLVHRKEQRNLARKGHLAASNGAGQTKQNRRGQFVVQEAALDVAALRHRGTRIHSDDIARLNAQLKHIILAVDIFIEQDLHVLLDGLDRLIGHMRRRLGIEDHTRVHIAIARVNGAVLAIGRRPLMPAERRGTQATIVLNGAYHGTQGIDMTRQDKRLTLATKLNEHVTLIRTLGPKPHIAQGLHQIISRRTGIARRRSNRGKRLQLVSNIGERRIHLGHQSHPFISN